MIRAYLKRNVGSFFILASLALILFFPLFFHPYSMIHSSSSDIITYFANIKEIMRTSYESYGSLPLWNPFFFSGSPLFENTQASFFNLFDIPFLIFNPDNTFGFLFIVFLFLSGAFLYIFTSIFKWNKLSSLVAAIVFMLSSVITSKIYEGSFMMIEAIAFIPLIFFFLELTTRKRNFYYFIGLLISLTLQILIGYLQVTFYTLLLASFYILLRGLLFKRRKPLVYISKTFLFFSLAVLFACLLSAVMLIPSYELAGHSTRARGITYEFAQTFSLPFRNVINIFIPTFFGMPNDGSFWGMGTVGEFVIYLGILPFILALLAFLFIKNRYTLLFFLLALFSLIFSFGGHTPLYYIFYKLPLFGSLRAPARMLIFYSFFIALLAGFGFNLINSKLNKKMLKRCSSFILLLICLLGYVIIISFIFYTFRPILLESALLNIANARVYGWIFANILLFFFFSFLLLALFKIKNGKKVGKLLGFGFLLSFSILLFLFLSQIDSSISTSYAIKNTVLHSSFVYLILLTGALTILFLRFKDSSFKKILKWSIFIFIILDLLIFSWSFIDVKEPGVVYPQTSILSFLEKDQELFRTIGAPRYASRYKISDINGYDPTIINNYYEYAQLVCNCTEKYPYLPHVPLNPSNIDNPKLLSLLNVKYLISTTQINNSNYILVHSGKEGNLYLSKDYFPRAFIVRNAKVITGKTKIFDELRSEDFNPREEVILEKDPGLRLKNYGKFAKINFTYYSPDKLTLNVKLQEPGYLVLSEIFYPGWKAFDNGKRIEIYKANYILRGIYLEKGEHIVEFLYDPLTYNVGLSITLMSFFSLAGIVIWHIFRTKTI